MVEPDQATLAVDDHGLTTGDGAFETLIALDHPRRTAFAIRRHLERLHRSCEVLGIEIAHTDDEIRDAIDACVITAPEAGVVRVTVTSGRGPLGSTRGVGPGTTVVIAGGGRPHYPDSTRVVVFPQPRNERGVMAGVKTSSYAENVVALRHAHQHNASEAIFGNIAGNLCEGTGSNIFWSDGHRLHTPPLESGCLAGITRSFVIENLDVSETDLPIERLGEVHEAFLTSSTRVVQSIAHVDRNELQAVGGPMTREAADLLTHLMTTSPDP